MEFIFGRKYKLNPETLRFEDGRIRGRQLLRRSSVIAMLVVGVAFGMRFGYEYFHKSPRLLHYENENKELRGNYSRLSLALERDALKLDALQRKDDRLYRSICEMEPLALTIREAGTGGATKYAFLKSIDNPELIIGVTNLADQLLAKARIQNSSLEDVELEAVKKQEYLSHKPSIQPISPDSKYWLTSTFGYRADPFTKKRKSHHGIDLAGPVGQDIYATGDGVVTFAKYSKYGYGKEVEVDHGFGYVTRYAHLHDILVNKGDVVKKGQVVGTLGNTGRSTGPHLHYEVRFFNRAVNPMHYYYDDLSAEEYAIIAQRALSASQ